jgi:hypothetical protein
MKIRRSQTAATTEYAAPTELDFLRVVVLQRCRADGAGGTRLARVTVCWQIFRQAKDLVKRAGKFVKSLADA